MKDRANAYKKGAGCWISSAPPAPPKMLPASKTRLRSSSTAAVGTPTYTKVSTGLNLQEAPAHTGQAVACNEEGRLAGSERAGLHAARGLACNKEGQLADSARSWLACSKGAGGSVGGTGRRM